jgi:hypothetical protein
MKGRKFSIFILALMISISFRIPLVYGQKEYHGADSVFRMEGVTILWAILKGSDENSSWVYTRIINNRDGNGSFQCFGVEAVDPFSNKKEWVVKGEKLQKENLVKSIRSSFKDMTGRRFLFYRSIKDFDEGRPAMIVYYMGVPDTAPEFISEKKLEDYFGKAVERLKK